MPSVTGKANAARKQASELEAIFLSPFGMISQNRAAAKQQALADQEWHTVQAEDQQNRQLLALSNRSSRSPRRCTLSRLPPAATA